MSRVKNTDLTDCLAGAGSVTLSNKGQSTEVLSFKFNSIEEFSGARSFLTNIGNVPSKNPYPDFRTVLNMSKIAFHEHDRGIDIRDGRNIQRIVNWSRKHHNEVLQQKLQAAGLSEAARPWEDRVSGASKKRGPNAIISAGSRQGQGYNPVSFETPEVPETKFTTLIEPSLSVPTNELPNGFDDLDCGRRGGKGR